MERLDKYPIVQARFRALGPPSKSWVVKSFPSKSFLLSRPLSLLSLLSPVRTLGTVRSPGQSGPDAQTFRRSPDSPAGHPGMSERGEVGGLLEPYEDEERENQQAIVCPSSLGPTGRSNEEFSRQSSPPPSASGPAPRSQGFAAARCTALYRIHNALCTVHSTQYAARDKVHRTQYTIDYTQ